MNGTTDDPAMKISSEFGAQVLIDHLGKARAQQYAHHRAQEPDGRLTLSRDFWAEVEHLVKRSPDIPASTTP